MSDDKDKLEMNGSLDENTLSSNCIEEKFPESIIFSEELNKFFQDRIRDLTAENGCLRRAFEQAEEKLRELSQEPLNSQKVITTGMPVELPTTKLMELSKKYRNQTAEMEALKTKCKHLESTLLLKEEELNHQRVELRQIKKSNILKDENQDISEKDLKNSSLIRNDEERIKCLKNRLHHVQAKLCVSKNSCAILRQDINKAQKLLCSEVGENVSISGLSSVPGGWRGRAEQIRNLQQKVVELQTRLSECDRSQKGFCDQHLANLRITEKEKRQQIENTTKELRQTEVALETSKRKLDASKARVKVLEHELNAAKENITMLNEKRSHDDRLIEILNERLKIAEAKYQEHEMEMQNREHKIERENTNIKNELGATQLHIDRLRRRLEEREIEIDKLRNNVMLDDFRSNEDHRMNLSVNSQNVGEPNEYVTLALAAETERVRLLELVTVLNQRLDKDRNEINTLMKCLHKERNKYAKLELRLRNLEKERVGLAKVNSGYTVKSSARLMSSLRTEERLTDPTEVRFKIELLEEECLTLRARLDTVQQEKTSDLTMYKRMLDQARKTFTDACRNKLLAAGSHSTVTI